MASNIKPSNSQGQSLAPTYRLQTVKAIFQGYPDELGSFWVSEKNQKTGKNKCKESNTQTEDPSPITAVFAKISPATKSCGSKIDLIISVRNVHRRDLIFLVFIAALRSAFSIIKDDREVS
jgi:hypothetical protein